MSIEPAPQLDLDQMVGEGALLERIEGLEVAPTALVTLRASVESLVRVKTALCSLRSRGLGALVLLTPPSIPLNDDEIEVVFQFLKDWDQLILHNVVGILGDRLEPPYLAALNSEAKIEMKWFQEWQVATADPRLHKYPALPWRSFIRKIVGENFRFVMELLGLLRGGAPSPEALDPLFRGFIEQKKKVVCIFPKRWGKA